MPRRDLTTRNLEFPVQLADRLAAIRDHHNDGLPTGYARATLPDALKLVLDWWDGTADMRAMGIDPGALAGEEVKRP